MIVVETITELLPSEINEIYIAYSGGMDSHALLHLCSSIQELRPKITAVYIHHGLQIEADKWDKHCKSVALALDVQFNCLTVNAQKEAGQSPEEAARNARYGALKPLLGKNDVLLVGQHSNDQMETVLLQLFRGAGLQGLSGMPKTSPFGKGKMQRPFLTHAQKEIREYAEKHQLLWVEDPSNQCDDFDRNFLRNQIIPQLTQRWQGLDKTISRSARHCASNQALIDDIARQLLGTLFDSEDQTLNVTQLLALSLDKQSLVIRQWFKKKQLRMPTEKNVQIIINEVALAKPDAMPEIKIQKHSIRRYKEKLYCLSGEVCPRKEGEWLKELTQFKLDDEKILILTDAPVGIPKNIWDNATVSVNYRKGEEKIKLPGREGRHTLKKLFQEKMIPPWERNTIPLIYINGHLAAISEHWISADFYSDNEACYILRAEVIKSSVLKVVDKLIRSK
jgi:tRNA(Ile)-lysidine synthase